MTILNTFIAANAGFGLVLALLLVIRRLSYTFWPTEKVNGVPRPPLVPTWIPFLGHALSLVKGNKFWNGVEQKYGPAVRLLVMGETKIFVTSTDLIQWVYRDSKSFNFSTIRCDMSTTVFETPYSVAHDPLWPDRVFAEHHRAMQPGAIVESVRRYTRLLEDGLRGDLEHGSGSTVNLVEYVYDVIYTASSKALLGPTFPAASTKTPFLAFDAAFPLLTLTTLPAIAYKSAHKARTHMIDMIEDWWRSITPEDKAAVAPHITTELEAAVSEGWSDRDWCTILLSELWALEANAPFAAIWTIVEILRRPSLLRSLRMEVIGAVESLSPPTLSSLLALPQAELVKVLPDINASFQETLRFHTSTFSMRVVQKDTVIPPNLLNGRGQEVGLSLKRGDQIICITTKNAVSPEGDWGVTADRWDETRWKEGKKGTMAPFGGGVSMCEGRHFASAEILTFIAAFMHLAEVEVVSDNMEENPQRIGLGVMQPKGDMRVRLAARAG